MFFKEIILLKFELESEIYFFHLNFDHVRDYVTRTHYPYNDFHFRTLSAA